MRLIKWLSGVVLVSILLVAGLGGAISGEFERNEDASGNGLDWLENAASDFDVAPEVEPKFGEGVIWNTSGDTGAFWSERSNDGFVAGSDVSLSMAIEVDRVAGDRELFISEDDDGGVDEVYEVALTGNGKIRFSYWNSGSPISCTATPVLSDGSFVSFWVRLDRGSVVTDTEVRMRLFDDSGSVLDDLTCTDSLEPDTSGSLLAAGLFNQEFTTDVYRGAIYEFRWWTELVAVTTLNQVTDPSDPSFQGDEVSTENALYFMEQLVVGAAEANFQNRLATHAVNLVEVGEPFEVKAFAINASGLPVATTSDMVMVVTRVEPGNGIQWLNVSSGEWSDGRVENIMEESLHSPFVWKVNVTVPSEDNVVVFTSSTVEDTQGLEVNVTGTHPVQVVDGLEVQSHATDLQAFTKLTALEMAWLVGAGVAGVVLWSKSLNPVVRTFGAALPMLAGALLLSFGASEGFGSMWVGTVPLAASMILLGISLVTWMGYEWLTKPEDVGQGGFM